ncbi:MAG: hypothetical protein R3Y35_09440 [Clostridia bacterium]
MFVLPFVFLCNTLIFLIILEERFKVVPTLCIGFGAFVVSLLLKSVLVVNFGETVLFEPVANAVNLGVLLVASIFFASNNILQKILLTMVLQFNFLMLSLVVPEIINVAPLEISGFIPLLVINLAYALICLVTAAIFWGPLHFFYRSSCSLSQLGFCLLLLLACCLCNGLLEDILNISSYSLTFFSSLFIYLVVVFSYRTTYGTTKEKIDDINSAADDYVMNIWADNFNSLVVNVNSNKILNRNMENSLNRIFEIASLGDIDEVLKYANHYKEYYESNPMLTTYCENPYLNAVIATKTSEAVKNKIELSCKVDLDDNHLSLVTTCAFVDTVLAIANEETKKVKREEKYIDLSVQTTGNYVTIESVFLMNKQSPKKFYEVDTLEQLFKNILAKKHEISNSRMDNLVQMTEKLNGTIRQEFVSNKGIIKIMLPK